MGALILENGREDYLMAKVHIVIFKLGIFKVKGEKPRAGYFEDNVLVNESRLHSKSKKSGDFREFAPGGSSLILAMIPEVNRKARKRKGLNSTKKRG